MMKSMTGYGRATYEDSNITVAVEVKSLNSKFLELSLKLPKNLSGKETEIRNLVSQSLERGKAFMGIEFNYKTKEPNTRLNPDNLAYWYKNLQTQAETLGATPHDLFRTALGMPEVLESKEDNSERGEEDWKILQQVIQEALLACEKFRIDEGKVLSAKLNEYIASIEERKNLIAALEPERANQTRTKLKEKLDGLAGEFVVDNNRFEQELIYYLEKLDVQEELVRLGSHLAYFIEAMGEGSGKKLGFIAQEIGREINTIGSKINDAKIQRMVVEMKDALEKIKEQSLNLL